MTTPFPPTTFDLMEQELRKRQRTGRRRHTTKKQDQEQQSTFDTLGLVRCEKCSRWVSEFEITTTMTATGQHKICTENCYGKSDASGRLWYNNQ